MIASLDDKIVGLIHRPNNIITIIIKSMMRSHLNSNHFLVRNNDKV